MRAVAGRATAPASFVGLLSLPDDVLAIICRHVLLFPGAYDCVLHGRWCVCLSRKANLVKVLGLTHRRFNAALLLLHWCLDLPRAVVRLPPGLQRLRLAYLGLPAGLSLPAPSSLPDFIGMWASQLRAISMSSAQLALLQQARVVFAIVSHLRICHRGASYHGEPVPTCQLQVSGEAMLIPLMFPALASLSLHYDCESIRPSLIRALHPCENLTSLKLSMLQSRDAPLLVEIGRLPRLLSLHLSDSYLKRPEHYFGLSALSQLTSLSLSDIRCLPPDDLDRLLGYWVSLRRLRTELSFLPRRDLPELRSLKIYIVAGALDRLTEHCPALTRLRDLNFSTS
jgi:hypothetical protein